MGAIIGPKVVREGLVCYLDAGNSYSYAGTGTTWADLTGQNDGTINNSPVYEDGRFKFVGTSNHHVSITGLTPSESLGENISYACTVNLHNRGINIHVIGRTNYPGSGSFLGIRDSGTNWGGHIYPGPLSAPIFSPGPNYGETEYVVMTINNTKSSASLYVDGELVNSHHPIVHSSCVDHLRVGAYIQGGWYALSGSLYTVQVYNRVLTPTEIRDNYKVMLARFSS